MVGSRKRVAIFSAHSADQFTGGRYHSWMMAEALSASGWDVTVFANEAPLVAREFTIFPAHNSIRLVVDQYFRGWEAASWDLIVLVPDLSPEARVFGAALRAVAQSGAPLAFLDFEAPSWYNAQSGQTRTIWRRMWWWLAARHSSLVISSSATGMAEALRYYRPLGGDAAFAVCWPAINDLALPAAHDWPEKGQRVICITRQAKGSNHKGSQVLEHLADWLPRGCTLTCIGRIDPNFGRALTTRAAARGVSIDCQSNLSDVQKFAFIAASRLMVFSSRFEGFGLPPIEAACAGTPCIVSHLDVIEETLGFGAVRFVPQNDTAALKAEVIKALASPAPEPLDEALRQKALQRFSFAAYCARLAVLVDTIAPPARGRLDGLDLALLTRFHSLWSSVMGLARKVLDCKMTGR